MKTFLLLMIIVTFALLQPGDGEAGEYVTVPRTLNEIINPRFRTAMAAQANDYNDLSRNRQIQIFIGVYKSLNKGQNPLLSPWDAGFFPGNAFYGSAFPSSTYANPWSGDIYQYYNNYGYRRFPFVSPLPPTPWSAAPFAAPSYSYYAPYQSGPTRSQTPPPYARPPVARPHGAAHPHHPGRR